MTLTHGALFNGIGGFCLSASWAGIPTRWTVEIDEFSNKVSKKHFPDAIQYTDIRTASNLPYIDVLSGGFPCQPFSVAGKQKGKADDRFLWPEMLRIIREVKPAYILGENVAGIINMALDEVLATLEAEDYTTETFVIPACGLQAPHRRDRVWIIAYSNEKRNNQCRTSGNDESEFSPHCEQPGDGWTGKASGYALEWNATDTNKERFQKQHFSGIAAIPEKCARKTDALGVVTNPKKVLPQGLDQGQGQKQLRGSGWGNDLPSNWLNFPTVSPILGGNDGISFGLHLIRRIENENDQYQVGCKKSQSEINFAIWEVLRTLWKHREIAAASPDLYISKVYDSLPTLPRENGSTGWLEESQENEGLRGMWEDFYTLPFKEAQDLQQRVLDYLRENERKQKVASKQRIDRIGALGNAIVPQVAYQIFEAIKQHHSLISQPTQ